MKPHSAMHIASELEARLHEPVTLVGGTALEFYTLGAVQASIVELAAPLGATGEELAKRGWTRAGNRWISADGTILEISAPRHDSAQARSGGLAFHVLRREEAILEAALRAMRTRHPKAWSALLVLWASQEARIDPGRLHAAAESAGCLALLDQVRRRLKP